MFKPNGNFNELGENYLFAEIARRVARYKSDNPASADHIISLGIGDVTLPLCRAVTDAMHGAVDEMSRNDSFRGYGPEQGYQFLRSRIAECDYQGHIADDEIFISDGAKSDLGNLTDLFGPGNSIAVCDPVYPVYVDSNIMCGNGADIIYMPCEESDGFLPRVPQSDVDVIYLCYPNNPVGVSMTRERMREFVDYAIRHKALIIYDSAYEAFVQTPGAVRSVYDIDGAHECAIEVRSFSKRAGFTGVRCGYTVVPHELVYNGMSLNNMWRRRQTTKFNGVSYIVQRAAEAVYTPEGEAQTQADIAVYRANADLMRRRLCEAGYTVYGGVDAPYVWVRTPHGIPSWQMFDILLTQCNVVVTPGSGFGNAGEGYVRLTSFNTPELTAEAVTRLCDFAGRHHDI